MGGHQLERISADSVVEAGHLFDPSSSTQSVNFYQCSRRGRLRGLGLCEACGGHPWAPRRYVNNGCSHFLIEQESQAVYESTLPDPSLVAETREEVEGILLRLVGERERVIIMGRIIGLTLEQLGRRLGVTRERIRQIESRAIRREVRYQSKREAGLE